MDKQKTVTKKDLQTAKLALGSEIQDLRAEMKYGFKEVRESFIELKELLEPTVRALDTTLLDIRDLKQRVAKLEKQAGVK